MSCFDAFVSRQVTAPSCSVITVVLSLAGRLWRKRMIFVGLQDAIRLGRPADLPPEDLKCNRCGKTGALQPWASLEQMVRTSLDGHFRVSGLEI